jgi:photosystem II stability/assembly factor-like uncharacterized protein
LKKYRTLYGVAMWPSNAAIAGGYSGQVLVRDPSPTLGADSLPHVWRDRSSYSGDPVNAVNSATLPLFGAATGVGAANQQVGVLTGIGGYVRLSTNGGQSWSDPPPSSNSDEPVPIGAPWRIRDVYFSSAVDGWQVGQFSRLAHTDDGGRSWSAVAPDAQLSFGPLNAITFDGADAGVAVGDAINDAEDPLFEKPRILFTTTSSTTAWNPADEIDYATGMSSDPHSLAGVDWDGERFWAVGPSGLILRSNTDLEGGPAVWTQWVPPDLKWVDISTIDFVSVSFRDITAGLFVGSQAGAPVVYEYTNSGGVVDWKPRTIAANVAVLNDIDVSGNAAFAVGYRSTGIATDGVLLGATFAGGNYGAFQVLASVPVPTVGEIVVPELTLNQVCIAPDANVWIGGDCGRLWKWSVGSSTLTSVKSKTDARIRGISFPTASIGYLGCHTGSRSGQSVVRVTTP